MALLLGIDIGAQSLKVGMMDGEGTLRALEQVPYSIQRPHRGWAEEDPEVWWDSFCRAVKTAMERNAIRSDQIESIGISTMCPALVAMDDCGNPLRPAILYLDQRSLPQSRRIQEEIGLEKVFQTTGNRIAPGTYSATSMLWIRDNEPDQFRRTRFFGHGNTFLARRLTGHFAFDWTNASFTGLFQAGRQRTWSNELCRDLRIPIELLPPPVISSTCIGTLTEQASQATKLPEGIPVAIGGADTACSAFGAGVVDPGQIFETSGTSDVLSFCADQPAFDIRFMNRCHVVPERWLLHGAMLSPGAALSWLRDQCCSEERQTAQKMGTSVYEVMDLRAEESPPGANGLLFLPYMRGERSPIWDPLARGVFFGLSLDTTRGDMIRSMLEGTAFGLRQNLEIAEQQLGFVARELRVVGGGSRSRTWSQIKADALRRPITTMDQQETAVLGAAMLGGMASGRFADVREAVANSAAQPRQEVWPNPDVDSLYNRMYSCYLDLYTRVKDLFQRMSEIQNESR